MYIFILHMANFKNQVKFYKMLPKVKYIFTDNRKKPFSNGGRYEYS